MTELTGYFKSRLEQFNGDVTQAMYYALFYSTRTDLLYAIEHGYNINYKYQEYGDSYFHRSANDPYMKAEMIICAIENGLAINDLKKNKNGNTIFHSNFYSGDILPALIKYGFDFNMKNNFKETIFHYNENDRCRKENQYPTYQSYPTFKTVIEMGLFNVNNVSNSNNFIYYYDLLTPIKYGLNLNICDSIGNTLLHKRDFDFEILKAALEAGFDPNKKNKYGETIFHCKYFDEKMLDLAIEYNFDVNNRDKLKNTIFHSLAKNAKFKQWVYDLAHKHGLLNAKTVIINTCYMYQLCPTDMPMANIIEIK